MNTDYLNDLPFLLRTRKSSQENVIYYYTELFDLAVSLCIARTNEISFDICLCSLDSQWER